MVIFLTTLSISILGDWTRDLLDPSSIKSDNNSMTLIFGRDGRPIAMRDMKGDPGRRGPCVEIAWLPGDGLNDGLGDRRYRRVQPTSRLDLFCSGMPSLRR